jgi:large subunit ribosomal protein L15
MAEEKKPEEKKPAAKAPASGAKAPAAKASTAKPVAAKPAAAKAPAAKAAAAKPAAAKPAAAKAPAAKAAAAKPAAAKPAAAKAPAAKAAVSKPAVAKAAEPVAKDAAPAAKSDTATSAASAESDVPVVAAKPAAKKVPVAKEERFSVVKLHHLRPAPGSKKAKTRVGRGEASKGKTAGRGTKGTQARYQVRPGFQGGQLTSVMRTPKLRGFTNPFRVEYQVVNVGRLSELYPKGGDVTIADLVEKGAVRKNEKVKVLADGNLNVALTVSVDKVSKQAAEKITEAGGSVKA